jgi:hypothetical protein
VINPVKAFTLFALALGLSAAEKVAYERLQFVYQKGIAARGTSTSRACPCRPS